MYFYQGSMRIKDFLPFIKARFAEHGWTIVDEETATASWFVMQKVALGGGVMTFAFKERNYPNYGSVIMTPALSVDMTQDGNGVYISGYDPVTKTLPKACQSYNSYFTYMPVNIATYTDTRIPYFNYFTSNYVDDEVTPVYLFYKMHIEDDSFCINVEGNPATTGHARHLLYGGAFEKTIPEFVTDDAIGLWGYGMNGFSTMVLSRLEETPTKWALATPSNFLDNYLFPIDGKHSSASIYTTTNHPSYPLAMFPKDIVAYTPVNPALIDGNNFVDINESKYIYYSDHSSRACFIKVIDGVSDLILKDNGTGYELTWANPNSDNMDKIVVYARSDEFPVDENDSSAVMVYEDTAPVKGGVGTFIDMDAGRYGSVMHYAVLVFDNATPNPNVSLVNQLSTVKATGNTIESFAAPVFKHHISMPSYFSSNEYRISPYFKADLMMPLNDSASTTDVVDLMGNYTGMASANTDTMTTIGKTGNALDLSPNRFVEISPALKMDGNFSIQLWYRDTDDTNIDARPFLGTITNIDSLGIDNSSNYGMYARIQSGHYSPQGAAFVPDTNLHFVTFSKQGCEVQLFRDGSVMTDVGSINHVRNRKFNMGEALTFLGKTSSATYGNIVIENFEKFDFAISELQHKESYNAGLGKVLDASDYVDGFAVVMSDNAQEHSVTCKLNEKKNITNKNTIALDVYASKSGSGIFSVIIEGAGLTISKVINIAAAKTWETQTIDISGMSDVFKANVASISIQGGTAAGLTIASIRNITAS